MSYGGKSPAGGIATHFPDVRLYQMFVGLRGVMFWGQKGLAARLSNQLIEVLHGDGGMGAEVDACVFTDDH